MPLTAEQATVILHGVGLPSLAASIYGESYDAREARERAGEQTAVRS